ncbi:BA75_01777T0 [Komagataella pastoris]|uniref:BA75_01777T0 n=1 Tax=Komagataella pastoris TaxID=4922 RepID=A0A1B2J8K3_PICPA|nr:BA75_01777T0 [Komagataella pastoris]
MDKDLKQVLDKDIDLYDLLGVPENSQDSDIRRGYRQQALIYHPDKNDTPQANIRFQQISTALKILGTPKLRNSYDSYKQLKRQGKERRTQLNERDKRFEQELVRAEEELLRNLKSQQSNAYQEAILREENLKLRRQRESKYLNLPSVTHQVESPVVVKLKWKNLVKGIFTEDEIRHIMSRFGRINKIWFPENNDNDVYHYCFIQFDDYIGGILATFCDYSKLKPENDPDGKSGSLVKLLRSCRFVEPSTDLKWDRREMSQAEYIGRTLLNLESN